MAMGDPCMTCLSLPCQCFSGIGLRGVAMYGAPAPTFPSYPNAFPKPIPGDAVDALDKLKDEMHTMEIARLVKERDEARALCMKADAEVARLRDRERRLVRVFWRVRYQYEGEAGSNDSRTRDGAEFFASAMRSETKVTDVRVYRVLVFRKAKVK